MSYSLCPYFFSIPDHFGTDFILAFPEGYKNATKIQMNIVALTSANVSITSPIPGVNRTVIVETATGTSVDLPTTLVQTSGIEDKYVRVQSDSDISVTTVQFTQQHSSDGYLAIPSNRMGTMYTFSNNNRGILSIVGLSYHTHITITVTSSGYLLSEHGSVKSLSMTLSKFKTYQVKCSTGTFSSNCMGYISTTSPCLLLYGSYIESYYSPFYTSYLEEGVQPFNAPLAFIVPRLSTSSSQIVYCLSRTSMKIETDNDYGNTYYSGSSYTYIRWFTTSKYIKTNQSASCTYVGHGFSTIIPPVKSYTNYYKFLTPSVTTFLHYAAIMILSPDQDGVRVDCCQPIIVKEESVTVDNISYSVLYVSFPSGQHEITHVNSSVSFGVILYGFGVSGTGSYAYPGGFKFN